MDGTEIAISESQERMAVVVDPKDVDEFMGYAAEENLEATKVAVVTEEPRLVLSWRGKKIVDLSRAFLDTNGAHQETKVAVDIPSRRRQYPRKRRSDRCAKEKWLETLKDLNVCSQKGLVEMFDGSIGAGFCIYAAWRTVSDDRDTGYGCKASGTDRRLRYGYHDELSDSIRICQHGVRTTELFTQ